MRIACLPSADLSYESGSIIFALQLYRNFTRRGHEVVILGSKTPAESAQVNSADLIVNSALLEHPVIDDREVSNDAYRTSMRSTLQFLFEQHKRKPLDVVYAQYLSFGSYAAAIFSRLTGVPFVVSSFGRDLTIGFAKIARVRVMGKLSGRVASAIIVPSAEVWRTLLQKIQPFHGRTFNVHMLPSPVCDRYLQSIGTKANLPGSPAVLTINSCFTPEKGIETIVRAFAVLLAKHPFAMLYIAGNDDHPQQIHKTRLMLLVEQLRASHRTVFTGYLPRQEVARHLSGCDIFVDARQVSNFSSVLIEAQFAHAVTLASDTRAAKETITDSVNGLLFHVGDDESLALAMQTISEDTDVARRLRIGCAEWARTKGSTYQESGIFGQLEGIFSLAIRARICA